jgi:hypothetical protein
MNLFSMRSLLADTALMATQTLAGQTHRYLVTSPGCIKIALSGVSSNVMSVKPSGRYQQPRCYCKLSKPAANKKPAGTWGMHRHSVPSMRTHTRTNISRTNVHSITSSLACKQQPECSTCTFLDLLAGLLQDQGCMCKLALQPHTFVEESTLHAYIMETLACML